MSTKRLNWKQARVNSKQARDEWQALSSRTWPGIVDRAAVLSWRFMVISDRVHAMLDPEIVRYGIQPGDFEVLVTLRIQGEPYELSPTAIYRARCLSSGGLTKIMHRLRKAGLIVRRADPGDRRSQLVRLTGKGKRVVEAAMDEMGRLEKKMFVEVAASDRKRLLKLLDGMMDVLEPLRDMARAR